MLRFIISFGLALCCHLYLFRYNLDLKLDAPPQLISDSSVSVTLNQALEKQPNNHQRESSRIEKLEPEVKPAPTFPPPLQKPPVSTKKNISRTIAIKKPIQEKKNIPEPIVIENTIWKKKKTIKPPEPAEVLEKTPVKNESFSKDVTAQPPQKKHIKKPVETSNSLITPTSSQTAELKQKTSLPSQATSSVIEARPLYQYNPKPEYPSLARRRGWQGIVNLLVEVTASGDVASVRIQKSCGYTILDKSALRAVKTWHFHPGTRDGKQSQSTVMIPVHFTLRK